VTIGGDNLSCPLYVYFGTTKAQSSARSDAVEASSGLTCGSHNTLDATSPAGMSGMTVPVSVETIEGYFTGADAGNTTANFTYT